MGILSDIVDAANKYSPLIKTGVAALSTYASYKDQQKKNQMQQAAYDDYIRDVAAAGDEASAAVALNLTPMTVSGVPTTKADVTDFTAVAAHGGLMSIPNKQRKRYAKGPEEFEVETMDEEVLTPFGLQQETGIDLTGEQVKYDQGSPRKNAAMVWGNMGTSDKEPYNFDFDIFFQSGDWMDMIKSEIGGGGDTQVASSPDGEPFMMEEFLQAVQEGFKGSYQDYLDQIDRIPSDYWGQAPSAEGIMQAAKGGRIGYRFGDEVIADQEAILKTPNEEIVVNDMEEIKGQTADYKYRIQQYAEQLADDDGKDWDFLSDSQQDAYYKIAFDLWGSGDMYAKGGRIGFGSGSKPKYKKFLKLLSDLEERSPELMAWGLMGASTIIPFLKKGGRVKKETGGIMNLGGLEKDYRTTGGFVPIGAYERKDDVPARLSKNEFVMTADAVRAAGGGSINRGAQRMYDTMKHLEASPTAKRMTV